MTDPTHITSVVAGPFGLPLMLVVLGTVAIAFLANVLALVAWLRSR